MNGFRIGSKSAGANIEETESFSLPGGRIYVTREPISRSVSQPTKNSRLDNDTAGDDASLVMSFLQGDAHAFEKIYTRYRASLATTASMMITSRADAADVVQDVFTIAMERLHQLENPSALAPWLAQILRREVYRRSREWRDVSSLSFLNVEGTEFSAPHDPRYEAASAIADETATLVRQSLDGLDHRDRALFETLARHHLVGSEVSYLESSPTSNWSESTSTRMPTRRMRQRLLASRSAYLVARYGQHSCPLLRQLLRHWNGEFDPLIRKRITRHIETCPQCDNLRLRLSSVALIFVILACTAPSNRVDPHLDTSKRGLALVVVPIRDLAPGR